ncbi:MAG: GH92 family glycosyl hydrolase, partial [Candidatus Hydrogenedentes bacterium]|nr:GH92 family glycosyl hydrolase [Candidatus Hydrogenedentota bacterium]
MFRVFPTVETRAGKMLNKGDRYARFSHRDETAFPGYYAVRLPKDDILVELTATPRVGVHRYTFRKSETPHLLVDITSVLGKERAEDGVVLIKASEQAIEGSVKTFGSFSGRYGGLNVYFAARFSQPFAKCGTWKDGRLTPGADGAAGKDIGADLSFSDKVVEVRLALSCVSIDNARKNLEAEAAGKSFDQIVDSAKDMWEKRFATVRIECGTKTQQRIFYTCMYHALLMPTTFSDVNGEYIGFDNAIHKAEGFTYFTDFSLWDTWRTVHPLYNLLARKDERDMMVSLVEMAKAGGCLPRWPSGRDYTNCMLGTPADIAVTEAYLKGIRDFDVAAAFECMRQTGLTGKPASSRFGGRDGLEWYLQYGYCPSDKMGDGVAATLEYSYEDYAISLLAEALGHKDDADLFARHSGNYRNLWNPASGYFEAKDTLGNFP